MTREIDDMLGLETALPLRRSKPRVSRGPLHDLITKALPDLKSPDGVCDLHKLAEELSMSYQGIYKWFRPGRDNRLPANQVDRIVEMSANQTTGGRGFKPAKREDFWPYLSP